MNSHEEPNVSHDINDEVITDASFSYNGYQVVRGEFFAHIKEPTITFNNCKIYVNNACVTKLPDTDYVQILVNPIDMKLVIRPSSEDVKDSFLWYGTNRNTGKRTPKQITCKVFFAKIVQLMDWNPDYRYKLLGKLIQTNAEHLFIFDLTASETYLRTAPNGGKPKSSRTPVFPAEWQNQFGLPVDEHQKSLQINIFNGYTVFGLKDSTQNDSQPKDNQMYSESGDFK